MHGRELARQRSGGQAAALSSTVVTMTARPAQDYLHLGFCEAVTPADRRPKENLAILGQEVEREQVAEAPAESGIGITAVGDPGSPPMRPLAMTLVSMTATGGVTSAVAARRVPP